MLSVVCRSETGNSERPVATGERRMALVVFPPRLGWKSRPGNFYQAAGQRAAQRKRLC